MPSAVRLPIRAPLITCYPPEAGRRIFGQRIVPDLLARPAPQARPVVVFLVGQHGAGKTRVAAMAADRLGGYGGFADLDSDLTEATAGSQSRPTPTGPTPESSISPTSSTPNTSPTKPPYSAAAKESLGTTTP
jgi:hypothetical protein